MHVLILALLLTQGTRADYERAESFRKLVAKKVFRSQIRPQWSEDGSTVWYRVDGKDGAREYIRVDLAAGRRAPAFDHPRMGKALKTDPKRIDIDRMEFGDGFILLASGKKAWRCDLSTYRLEKAQFPPTPKRPSRRNRRSSPSPKSPDGKWTAFFKDHNVHLKSTGTGESFVLSRNGSAEDSYGGRLYWSPDSRRLIALRTRRGSDRRVYLVESSPKDQLQPKLHSYAYRKPGDKIPLTKPHLFDIESREEIALDEAFFSNPWHLRHLRWTPDSREFRFLYNQRGHQILRVLGIGAEDGKVRIILEEKSKTFIDYAYKLFNHAVEGTDEIIWMSERDGWNHLYLHDAASGRVKNQITKGSWVVRGVDHVDEKNREIWFRLSGIDPDQDPYYIHHARIRFDGTGFVRLTRGNGTHAIQLSPDRQHLVDTYSRVDLPNVSELRRTSDGSLVSPLETSDISELLKTGWRMPDRLHAKGRDGKTDIYGVIWRPTNFDPSKRYPVIEKIYAGPHGSFVPKAFRSYHSAQPLAELGFIVVQIDGMGTSNRSKAFHDVCWKNLGDSGFPDRILWMKAAAKNYPSMDLSRVGIYGGSAGGQSSTRALLAHGDFYKVAVSDCGCHDNRMDKIWWNELWMGWPVGPHYKEQSNVTQAHKLKGKLLLIVGELDRNVDPASTLQVVNALIKADRDFDMLVIPGSGHGIGGKYGIRRRRDFFVRHLLGVAPRSE